VFNDNKLDEIINSDEYTKDLEEIQKIINENN
jgi:hypothetical protein